VHLKAIALKHANELLDIWDPATESWVPGALKARIDLTDRFLSNFNKPTRRRMLFADNTVVFPDSLTVRHPGTLDVYILGTTRKDARMGKAYVGLTICQLVTEIPGGSAGFAVFTRKAPVGPANDPGWLVEVEFARAFADMEFRNSANEPDATELKVENYLVYAPQHVQLQEWDYMTLHGKKYKVIDSFPDSGFTSGRVDEEVDTRINFYLDVEGEKTYDRLAQKWLTTPRRYNVTGVMQRAEGFALWAGAEDYIDVYIEHAHIGIEPKANIMSLMVDGKARVIRQVSSQSGKRQWLLRCN